MVRTYRNGVAVGAAVIVLAMGAIGKASLLFHPVAAGQRGVHETVLLALLVLFETGLAWWLASGAAKRTARIAALLTFFLFACVAAWKVWQGDTDCGCFGILEVHPALTLVVDLCLLFAIGFAPPHGATPSTTSTVPIGRRRLLTCLGLAAGQVTVALLAGWVIWSHHGAHSARLTRRVVWGAVQRGQRPHVLDHIRGNRDLGTGRWLLLFYREGCRNCEAELKQVTDGVIAWEGQIGVVSMSPNDKRAEEANSVDWFQIADEGTDWVIDTPTAVSLVDGKFYGYYDTIAEATVAFARRET